MGLQIVTNIDIDFYDKKYILINAKQLDKKSRFLSFTCYNHGELYSINAAEHSAYIRYKKSDNNSVFNLCSIDRKGKILVELTEQMLASDGICYADLVLINKGSAVVDENTGKIVMIDNSGILSTMTFCIDVSETAIENSDIESSYEYNGLNEALEKAEAEYSDVIRMAKSYACGNTGIRELEEIDNAKYYYEQSLINSNNASIDAKSAKQFAELSQSNSGKAATSCNYAMQYMTETSTYAQNAKTYMENAKVSEENSKVNSSHAQQHANIASNSASSAAQSETNAYNYYLQTEAITNGLNGAFLPKGTIEFSELQKIYKQDIAAPGYLYHIVDNFITDDTFRVGSGFEYTAGTNVYYTADGTWDCLVGTTVTGVKGDNETIYRKGNVNLTAYNVGAIPTTDIATVDEIKTYLGII